MTHKTNQTWQDWLFFWATGTAVTSIIQDRSLRLPIICAVITLRPLYWFLWQRTIDVPGLIGVGSVAVMAVLMWLHPGLPFFLFAAIVFIGFVIAPIYVSLRQTKLQHHTS